MARTIQFDVWRRSYARHVGFNPFRRHESTTVDVVIVVVFLVITAVVVAWAILGG